MKKQAISSEEKNRKTLYQVHSGNIGFHDVICHVSKAKHSNLACSAVGHLDKMSRYPRGHWHISKAPITRSSFLINWAKTREATNTVSFDSTVMQAMQKIWRHKKSLQSGKTQ